MTRKRSATRTRLHDWLWDTQMRRLPRALVALMVASYVAMAAGAVLIAVRLGGGAA